RTVPVTEQQEVTPRREAAVPCPSLYQYSLAGWRLDRDRTRRERGNSPGDTGTDPALCYVYRPPEMQPVVRNRTERGCCPGWSGARCTE
ncbi:SCO-spondin-like, partial [Pyrgilauda ruficollis]